jgi:hypothetical protein
MDEAPIDEVEHLVRDNEIELERVKRQVLEQLESSDDETQK